MNKRTMLYYAYKDTQAAFDSVVEAIRNLDKYTDKDFKLRGVKSSLSAPHDRLKQAVDLMQRELVLLDVEAQEGSGQ